MKRKITALLLLIVMLLSELPVRTAEAAPADTDVVGNTHITYDVTGKKLYQITVENGNLCIQGEYVSNSEARLSYHTAYLYFTTEPTEGYPKTASNAHGGQNYYAVNVKNHTTKPSNRAGYVYDTYVINAQTLDAMAEALFGDRDALKGGGKSVYISEGYVLKERTSTSADWELKSKELDTIDAIQNAADWSDATYYNFPNYYDIKLDINLEPYQVSVSADEGGSASVGKVSNYYGDSVSVKAVATKEDYVFTGWEIKEGDVVLEDALAESTTFLMPESNVSLHATFEYQGGPTVPPTMPPVATPTPKLTTKPGLTLPPTPIPTSTPIPTPTYYPEDTDQIRKHRVRYYTSDAGYTMETIYNENGLLADNTGLEVQGKIKSNTYTKMDASYQLGTDSAGNTWYFIASGSDATYVHPAVYEGNNVNTEEVRNITELTFPETITYRGTDYTVTSIGGGTSMYKTSNSSSTDNSSSSTTIFSDTSSGYYSYWKYLSNENTSRLHEQTYTTDIEYAYGVAGTGFITSEGLREFYWHYYDSGERIYDTEDYINSYYVHNTTLQLSLIHI